MARRAPSPTFVPRRLGRRDLQAPYTAALRRLPAVHRDDLQRRRKALLDATDPFGGPARARLLRHVLGGAVLFPLLVSVLWFFWHARSGGVFLAMPVLGATWGAFVVLLRPGAWISGVVLALAGIALLALDGTHPFAAGAGLVWFFHVVLLCVGLLIGTTARDND